MSLKIILEEGEEEGRGKGEKGIYKTKLYVQSEIICRKETFIMA